MKGKWIGAALILAACGSFGFSMASAYRNEEKIYRNLIWILSYMKAELQFHLTPLPDLCSHAAAETDGIVGKIFEKLSIELRTWKYPDASDCMQKVLCDESAVSPAVRKILLDLGSTLGQFDLNGQIEGINLMKTECGNALKLFADHREERLRGYRTLGLCTGAALVILFI